MVLFESIVVLGHTLNDQHKLSLDSQGRMDTAIALYHKNPCHLVLSAGDDRWHDNVNVAQKMKEYALEQGVAEKDIFLEPWAKDTVAEYIFLRKLFSNYSDQDLRITFVTHDWHFVRAKYLLKIVWPKVAEISRFVIVDSKNRKIIRTKEDDRKSIAKFNETFEGVDFSDLNSVFKCLFAKHGLYVGDDVLKQKVLDAKKYKFDMHKL
ncbi:hypothetical protein CL619_02075 [archaeon]|nr:hypothetical protein [archaeon]|tara:strand:+ start:1465 stop:2088 length:624 start_codon:yes stop_codon:yes gene_type:complete